MMIHPDHKRIDNLSGYLLTSYRAGAAEDWLEIAKLANCAVEGHLAISGWFSLIYSSNEPLLNEPHDLSPPFEYRVVIRVSGHKALLLSPSRRIVEKLLDTEINAENRRHLNKVPIDVDSFVRQITARPEKYLINFVHARIDGFGDALRAISFYGDDISRAKQFRDQLDMLTCYTCGISDIASRVEIMRLGSIGTVSFSYIKSLNGASVDAALKYISEQGFLRGVDFNVPD